MLGIGALIPLSTSEVPVKKDFGAKPYLYPMPVLMIATYNDDGTPDVMNMAWGGICANNMVTLNITETHRTSENIKKRGAFTLSIADVPHLKEADFFGIASANKMPDKFARSGLTAVASDKVDAPIIEEFPLTMECEVVQAGQDVRGFRVVGKIISTLADESVLDEDGKIDPTKLQAFAYDPYQNGYYALGEKVGDAWGTGRELMDE